MVTKKDILCPHCNIEYITQNRFNDYGKCLSCMRRETIAKTKNLPYIKFVDLPQAERDRLIKQREQNNSYNKKKSNSTSNNGNKESSKKPSKRPSKKLSKNQYEEVDGVRVRVRDNTIYTPEIISKILEISGDDISAKDILAKLQELYPDKPFTYGNLSNIISRRNIPHKTKTNKATEKFSAIIEDDSDTNVEDEVEVVEPDVYVPVEKSVENVEKHVDKSRVAKINTEELPERFNPVIDEVDGVSDAKFRMEHCQLDRNYESQDYINTIERLMKLSTENCDLLDYLSDIERLVYITTNGQDIVNKRRSQQNIMNAYQSDVIHEIENVISEDGNTYLGDKLHIIRNYRRYYEMDYRNVATLRPLRDNMATALEKLNEAFKLFKESLDPKILNGVLENLKKNQNYVENPVFKPMVDTTMIDKYEWVKPMDTTSAKSKISVVHYNPDGFNKGTVNNGRPVTRIGMSANTPPTNQLKSKIRKSLKIFRVSCKVSGGGYGVFQNWYRDYECTNKDTALSYAKNTLNQLSQTRKGMVFTDLDVVELNVDNTPVKAE